MIAWPVCRVFVMGAPNIAPPLSDPLRETLAPCTPAGVAPSAQVRVATPGAGRAVELEALERAADSVDMPPTCSSS